MTLSNFLKARLMADCDDQNINYELFTLFPHTKRYKGSFEK